MKAFALLLAVHDKSELAPGVNSFTIPSTFPSSNIARTYTDESASRLFAAPLKGKKNKRKKQHLIANNNRNIETVEEKSAPKNLKRKVQAKRPPLGHRIPKVTRTTGCESTIRSVLILEQEFSAMLLFAARRACVVLSLIILCVCVCVCVCASFEKPLIYIAFVIY